MKCVLSRGMHLTLPRVDILQRFLRLEEEVTSPLLEKYKSFVPSL